MRFRFVALFALSAALSGCGDASISSESFAEFDASYWEVRSSLAEEAQTGFDRAVRKIVAFQEFNPDRLDFTKGVVQVDIASILPEDSVAFQQTAFLAIGKGINGMTAQDVFAWAAQSEAEMIRRYQATVDRDIAAVKSQRDAAIDAQKQRQAVLDKVQVDDAIFTRETSTDGTDIPTLLFTLRNGTGATLHRIDMRAVLPLPDGEIIQERFSVGFDESPVQPGEERPLRLRMGSATWVSDALSQAPELSARIRAVRYIDDAGTLFDGEDPEIIRLQELLVSLIEHRKQAAEIVAASFR